jgi:hypothetical protein
MQIITAGERDSHAHQCHPKEKSMQRLLVCGAVGLALMFGAFASTPASAHKGWGWRHHHHNYNGHTCWWKHGKRHCRWWW